MTTEEKFGTWAFVVVVTMLMVTLTAIIASHTYDDGKKPDMSQCELLMSPAGDKWYECPVSMGGK
jgi:hypothetical protein